MVGIFNRGNSRARIECEGIAVDAAARGNGAVFTAEDRDQRFFYFGAFKVLKIRNENILCSNGTAISRGMAMQLDRGTKAEIGIALATRDYMHAYVLALNFLAFELEKQLRCAAEIGERFEVENNLNIINKIKHYLSDGVVVGIEARAEELPSLARAGV